jgi:hypothetical protein
MFSTRKFWIVKYSKLVGIGIVPSRNLIFTGWGVAEGRGIGVIATVAVGITVARDADTIDVGVAT